MAKHDVRSLPAGYQDLHADLATFLPDDRIIVDPLRTLAYGTDASFYRLVPKIVVKARGEDEVARILAAAAHRKLPVTFRAAGTSLSGQAVSDSVLVMIGALRGIEILDGGERVRLGPGVIGAEANLALAPHRRKLGPD